MQEEDSLKKARVTDSGEWVEEGKYFKCVSVLSQGSGWRKGSTLSLWVFCLRGVGSGREALYEYEKIITLWERLLLIRQVSEGIKIRYEFEFPDSVEWALEEKYSMSASVLAQMTERRKISTLRVRMLWFCGDGRRKEALHEYTRVADSDEWAQEQKHSMSTSVANSDEWVKE